MIPRTRRLTTKLFDQIIGSGIAFHSPFFTFKVLKNTQKQSRFAVAASKKHFKTAVLRNKIRRRVYSALASFLPRLQGAYGILIVKPAVADASPTELRAALESIFVKSALMK